MSFLDALISSGQSGRTKPTDRFMDDLYNQGLMDSLVEAYIQSGHAPGYSMDNAPPYADPGSDPFYGGMYRWLRRSQNRGASDLIHPLLRGLPGPLPPR